MSEILVTGYSGFIGRFVTQELLKRGYQVCGLSTKSALPEQKGLRQVHVDLLDKEACSDFFKHNHFDTLFHLAWYVGPKCHGANINLDFLSASLHLLKCFHETGGKTFLGNGTVSEYDFSYGYLEENKTPLENKSLHGICKTALYKTAQQYAKQNEMIFKWPRCFNLYGPYERPQRLMPSVILSCLKGEDVKVSDCLKFQDYLYVEDTARGICDIFESNLEGACNVCSGNPVQLRTIVEKIADITCFQGKILWGAIPSAFGDNVVVGNNEKLKSIGWKQEIDLEQGLEKTINWWRNHNV